MRAPGTQGGTGAGAQEQLPLPAQQSSKNVAAAPEQAEYPRDVLLRVRLIAQLPTDELEEAAAASNQRWRARLEGRIRRRLERACSHTVEYVDILGVSMVGADASKTCQAQVPMQGVRVEVSRSLGQPVSRLEVRHGKWFLATNEQTISTRLEETLTLTLTTPHARLWANHPDSVSSGAPVLNQPSDSVRLLPQPTTNDEEKVMKTAPTSTGAAGN